MPTSWVPFFLDIVWFKIEIKNASDWKAAVDFYAGDVDLLLDMKSVNPSRIGIADFGICPRHKDNPTLREWAIENGMIELLEMKGGEHERIAEGRSKIFGNFRSGTRKIPNDKAD